MRDVARIEVMIKALHDAWLRHPDMRLGQLIVNNSMVDEPCDSVFYIEDEQMLANLRDF